MPVRSLTVGTIRRSIAGLPSDCPVNPYFNHEGVVTVQKLLDRIDGSPEHYFVRIVGPTQQPEVLVFAPEYVL